MPKYTLTYLALSVPPDTPCSIIRRVFLSGHIRIHTEGCAKNGSTLGGAVNINRRGAVSYDTFGNAKNLISFLSHIFVRHPSSTVPDAPYRRVFLVLRPARTQGAFSKGLLHVFGRMKRTPFTEKSSRAVTLGERIPRKVVRREQFLIHCESHLPVRHRQDEPTISTL